MYNSLAGQEIPAQPQKNGNISQLWWRVRGRSAEAWGLEYDYLNRLTQAKHVAAHDGGAKIMGQYSEKLTYADARGNIAAIQRYGVIPGASYPSGMIDNLSFTMKPGSNQLQRVADSAPTEFAPRGFKPTAGAQNIDYSYDPVGNQTSDPHKGITITYNYLNLPSVILWSNGNKMEMSYDAMGTKLSKKVSVGATEQYTQHYLGGRVQCGGSYAQARGDLFCRWSGVQYQCDNHEYHGGAALRVCDPGSFGEYQADVC